MLPQHLSIHSFQYDLPNERIANFPLEERDASKLLVYNNGVITESNYKNIAADIPTDALLVFNNTKVVEARILFRKETGATIELFCLEPGEEFTDITTAMMQTTSIKWHCMVGGAAKWKKGRPLVKKIDSPFGELILEANFVEKQKDFFIIQFSWSPTALSFAEVLHYAGAIPLPPYIKRAADSHDGERYQTIYAQHNGSVAAPTAGLHFTQHVFDSLATKNIQKDFVTLHVGAGTFKPVKADTMAGHEMHAEYIDVTRETIEHLLAHIDKTIIPVGTTSLRTIESLYWFGVKIKEQTLHDAIPTLSQWEAYELASYAISANDSLQALLHWMKENGRDRFVARTQIIIAPGYHFRIVGALITNFHQPQSTLLLLVAAMVGEEWKRIYDYALAHDYRFLSYGDGCLLWPVSAATSSMEIQR